MYGFQNDMEMNYHSYENKRAQIDLIREVAEENQISLKDLKAKDMVDKIAQKIVDGICK